MKLRSIPEDEPLFKILKSRAINISKIKDKDERAYWRELKRINAIPSKYLSQAEIEKELKNMVGGKNGKGFN